MWNYDRLLQKTFKNLVLLSQLVFRAIRTARSVNSQGRRSPSMACVAPGTLLTYNNANETDAFCYGTSRAMHPVRRRLLAGR